MLIQDITQYANELYRFFFMFIIWSFLGWIVDVLGTSMHDRFYTDRGFLSMPLCPIYGFGMAAVILLFRPFVSNVALVFLLSMVLCTAVELFTGFLLKFIFHRKWWDYTDKPFNFMGLICLDCSLFWGLACVFALAVIVPGSEFIVNITPLPIGITFVSIMGVLMLIDTVSAVAAAFGHPVRLRSVQRITFILYSVSHKLGKAMAEPTLRAYAFFRQKVKSLLFYSFQNRAIYGWVQQLNIRKYMDNTDDKK